MGPLSLVTLHALRPASDPVPQPAADPPPRGMTLLQVQSLNHLMMGNIRTVRNNVLGLRRGIQGYGRNLFKVHFHPWHMRSIVTARRMCLEVARTRYRFDLLFVERGPDQDIVNVLCPVCQAYWPWHEHLPNNLRATAGRLCPVCAAH